MKHLFCLCIFFFLFSPNNILFSQLSDEFICSHLSFTEACDETSTEHEYWDSNLRNPEEVRTFYANRNCFPAWYLEGKEEHRAETILEILEGAEAHGLPSSLYNTKALAQELEILIGNALTILPPEPLDVANFDIKVTDSAISYAKHLAQGLVNPETHDIFWEVTDDALSIPELLNKSIKENKTESFFDSISPQHPNYKSLQKAYKDLDVLIQSNELIDFSISEKPEAGDSSSAVIKLRSILKQWYPIADTPNYFVVDTIKEVLKKEMSDSTFSYIDTSYLEIDSFYYEAYYDTTLLQNLKKFQWQNGLDSDGEIGSQTLSALNNSLWNRKQQIEINLERWRWCPTEFGKEHLLVNIPAYYLHAYSSDSLSLNKVVVTGAPWTRTVVFSDQLRYIEFNPYWNLPFSISTKEILPKLKKDPSYLTRNNMKLFSGGKSIDPYGVDWSEVYANNFQYQIRQEPGVRNALGLVKFLFPNQYSIYLHDTPSKKYFEEVVRAFSHGCVRLKNPFELSTYLLRDSKKWTPEKVDGLIAKSKNKRIELDETVPIYLLYLTTWVDEDGRLRFQHDIYKRDERLSVAWGKAKNALNDRLSAN